VRYRDQLLRQLADEENLLADELEMSMYDDNFDLNVILQTVQRHAGAKIETSETEHYMRSNLDESSRLDFLLKARQLKLISNLQLVYPITRGKTGKYKIRGLTLSSETIQKSIDNFAIALGYIAHLVLLLTKYLQKPLRYPILYGASRSYITDPCTESSSGMAYTLPLFWRGSNSEREKIDLAILWLKRDIEQILSVLDVHDTVVREGEILSSLYEVLRPYQSF
jgi:hypothetical protein